MRLLLGCGLVLVGVGAGSHGWWPAPLRALVPVDAADWMLPLGAVLAALGLVALLWRAPRRPAFGDGPLITTLTDHGFRLGTNPDGWQATGVWKGVPLVVRRSSGHAAGRFGRPWTIVVALPGQPGEPWPFLPEEGLIVDHRDDGFSVAMADLSRPERMHRLGERLDELLRHRR
jgi:hypothetical protein